MPHCAGKQRQEVDRNQVHGVHDEHPDENGDGQRGDQRALAVEGVLDLLVNEANDHFNEILQSCPEHRR